MIALPIPIVMKIPCQRKQKIAILATFLVAGGGTLASCIRLYSIKTFTESRQPMRDAAPISTWSFIEINLGILCASSAGECHNGRRRGPTLTSRDSDQADFFEDTGAFAPAKKTECLAASLRPLYDWPARSNKDNHLGRLERYVSMVKLADQYCSDFVAGHHPLSKVRPRAMQRCRPIPAEQPPSRTAKNISPFQESSRHEDGLARV